MAYVQGEELKKIIGAAVYVECSSKTQQVSDSAILGLKCSLARRAALVWIAEFS